MLSRHSVGTYFRNELRRNSSGNAYPQSSQLAQPLWTDSGLESGADASELISTKKEKKRTKAQAEAESLNIPQNPHM